MAKLSEENLINIRNVELAINRNLFIICAVITVVTMAMITIEFFSRGNFFPSQIDFFYVGVLFIYTVHKEMLRWLEEKGVERQGEIFLYPWIGLTTLFYAINFFTKDHYSTSLEGRPLGCMADAAAITLEVAVIFLLARLSKVVKIILMKRQK